jgi:hypothetical protein
MLMLTSVGVHCGCAASPCVSYGRVSAAMPWGVNHIPLGFSHGRARSGQARAQLQDLWTAVHRAAPAALPSRKDEGALVWPMCPNSDKALLGTPVSPMSGAARAARPPVTVQQIPCAQVRARWPLLRTAMPSATKTL